MTTADAFAIEFDHPAADAASYADRCGCPACERYRATHDAPSTLAPPIPASFVPAATFEVSPETRRAIPLVRDARPTDAAPALVASLVDRTVNPAAAHCTCPRQSRPLSIHGVCPACNLRRAIAPRTAAPVAAPADTSNPLGIRQLGTVADDSASVIAGLRAQVRGLENQLTLTRSVVAGAKTDGSGVFLGYAGLNQLTRADVAAVLAEAGAPADWLPAAKSAHAQAGRLVGELSRSGYVVRATRAPKGAADISARAREWRAQWSVGTAVNGSGVVGGSFGRTVLVATLTTSDELRIDGDEALAGGLLGAFAAAVSGEIYAAADITAWLGSILVSKFRACRVGGCWYVRAKYAADAEQLCNALAKRWGRDWLLPAIPMATCDQLRAGLVKSFTDEAERVLAVYAAELAEAAKDGKGEIGSKRAATLYGEIKSLAERAVEFSALFDSVHLAQLRAKLSTAANRISESTDGIAIRFENIFDELARDAAREA